LSCTVRSFYYLLGS